MNQHVVVIGLALAMFGTVVAGQTAQKDAPVPIMPLGQTPPTTAPGPITVIDETSPRSTPVPITPATGGFSNAYPNPRRGSQAYRVVQAQQGQTTFRVESGGPKLMRVHIATDGVEQAVLESVGFTVTTGASGTTLTASGPVMFSLSDGKKFSLSGVDMHFGPTGFGGGGVKTR